MLLSCPQRGAQAEGADVGAQSGASRGKRPPSPIHLDDPLWGQPVEFESGQRTRGLCRGFIIGFETSCSDFTWGCWLNADSRAPLWAF